MKPILDFLYRKVTIALLGIVFLVCFIRAKQTVFVHESFFTWFTIGCISGLMFLISFFGAWIRHEDNKEKLDK